MKKQREEVKSKKAASYGGDGLQQAEVDADEPVEVFVGKPEALHVKVHLRGFPEVRHFLRQDLAVEHQRELPLKVLAEDLLCAAGLEDSDALGVALRDVHGELVAVRQLGGASGPQHHQRHVLQLTGLAHADEQYGSFLETHGSEVGWQQRGGAYAVLNTGGALHREEPGGGRGAPEKERTYVGIEAQTLWPIRAHHARHSGNLVVIDSEGPLVVHDCRVRLPVSGTRTGEEIPTLMLFGDEEASTRTGLDLHTMKLKGLQVQAEGV
ncbi:hypothetical protein EYF80_049066 [Liparis tanakae]|uniref:Uncharacterized protein n=1 Tax=Liparis tanakae TaxID=230148 RepID=A0A4Z2FKG5_9TELE|nr:hypothetical protein EYF80_049066 [Liparis tanakae]